MIFNVDAFLMCVCRGTVFLGLFFFMFSCGFRGIKRFALLLSMGLMAVLGDFILYKLTGTMAAIVIYAVVFFGILGAFGNLLLVFPRVTSGNDEAKIQVALAWAFSVLCIVLMVFSVSSGLVNI